VLLYQISLNFSHFVEMKDLPRQVQDNEAAVRSLQTSLSWNLSLFEFNPLLLLFVSWICDSLKRKKTKFRISNWVFCCFFVFCLFDQAFAQELGAEFVTTSAKDGTNIEKLFEMAPSAVLKHKAPQNSTWSLSQTPSIH
jgi:hypothetical protein